jgi:hypothetical protein
MRPSRVRCTSNPALRLEEPMPGNDDSRAYLRTICWSDTHPGGRAAERLFADSAPIQPTGSSLTSRATSAA